MTVSPSLPPFARSALLLDVDGTLLDFAPTPESVSVPPGLIDVLRGIRAALSDALGVVSGRPISDLDRLLNKAPFAVAGEHGGVLRHAPEAPEERPALPSPPSDWLEAAERAAAAQEGARVERKARGFVLHYREAPEAGTEFGALMRSLIAQSPGFEVLDGNMAWEIRPLGADKGRAVAALMAKPPFSGRLPVFIGDDVTDYDGIREAKQMGGEGLLVADAFGGPAQVREWLSDVARTGGW